MAVRCAVLGGSSGQPSSLPALILYVAAFLLILPCCSLLRLDGGGGGGGGGGVFVAAEMADGMCEPNSAERLFHEHEGRFLANPACVNEGGGALAWLCAGSFHFEEVTSPALTSVNILIARSEAGDAWTTHNSLAPVDTGFAYVHAMYANLVNDTYVLVGFGPASVDKSLYVKSWVMGREFMAPAAQFDVSDAVPEPQPTLDAHLEIGSTYNGNRFVVVFTALCANSDCYSQQQLFYAHSRDGVTWSGTAKLITSASVPGQRQPAAASTRYCEQATSTCTNAFIVAFLRGGVVETVASEDGVTWSDPVPVWGVEQTEMLPSIAAVFSAPSWLVVFTAADAGGRRNNYFSVTSVASPTWSDDAKLISPYSDCDMWFAATVASDMVTGIAAFAFANSTLNGDDEYFLATALLEDGATDFGATSLTPIEGMTQMHEIRATAHGSMNSPHQFYVSFAVEMELAPWTWTTSASDVVPFGAVAYSCLVDDSEFPPPPECCSGIGDDDSDSVCNDVDQCPGEDDLPDGDSDTVIDCLDVCAGEDDLLDGDSDSVPDCIDTCPGGNDALDNDSDGVPDSCDLCDGGDDSIDTNSNSVPDFCDPLPTTAASTTAAATAAASTTAGAAATSSGTTITAITAGSSTTAVTTAAAAAAAATTTTTTAATSTTATTVATTAATAAGTTTASATSSAVSTTTGAGATSASSTTGAGASSAASSSSTAGTASGGGGTASTTAGGDTAGGDDGGSSGALGAVLAMVGGGAAAACLLCCGVLLVKRRKNAADEHDGGPPPMEMDERRRSANMAPLDASLSSSYTQQSDHSFMTEYAPAASFAPTPYDDTEPLAVASRGAGGGSFAGAGKGGGAAYGDDSFDMASAAGVISPAIYAAAPQPRRGNGGSGGRGGGASMFADDAIPITGGGTAMLSPSGKERWFIDAGELEFGEKLGSGAFGEVFAGKWRRTKVAIKKINAQIENDGVSAIAEDFAKEAELMSKLRPNPNVVLFLGVSVLPDQSMAIVAEFMPGGSLEERLLDVNARVTVRNTVRWAAQIAAGMQHLESERVVHRDLAARNVLLSDATANAVCKITDFGMSRVVDPTQIYNKTQTTVGPLKWMAAEAMKDLKYSSKSDVWSFAVTLLEMLHRGPPYPLLGPLQVSVAVVQGQLSPKDRIPPHAPAEMRDIITRASSMNPDARPTFREIYTLLRSLEARFAPAGYQQ